MSILVPHIKGPNLIWKDHDVHDQIHVTYSVHTAIKQSQLRQIGVKNRICTTWDVGVSFGTQCTQLESPRLTQIQKYDYIITAPAYLGSAAGCFRSCAPGPGEIGWRFGCSSSAARAPSSGPTRWRGWRVLCRPCPPPSPALPPTGLHLAPVKRENNPWDLLLQICASRVPLMLSKWFLWSNTGRTISDFLFLHIYLHVSVCKLI